MGITFHLTVVEKSIMFCLHCTRAVISIFLKNTNYAKLIYERWFKTMFEMADQVPRKYIDIFEDILEGFTNDIRLAQSADKSDQKPV